MIENNILTNVPVTISLFILMLLKQIIALLFLLIITASTFSINIISCNFYFNQNYIAKNLCENRNKPQLHCNGKCVLQKKINQENNKEKQAPDKRNENQMQLFASNNLFNQLHLHNGFILKEKYYTINAGSPLKASFTFFHPPQYFFI